MTITRDAFVRNLPAAVAQAPFRVLGDEGDEFVHQGSEAGWRIRLMPLPARTIGSLVLERHSVEIQLWGFDATAERAFLDRFDAYFRRAGG